MPETDHAEVLRRLAATATAKLPATPGANMLRQAAAAASLAVDRYTGEIADVDKNWAKLEAGAAAHRRAAARRALDEAVANANAAARAATVVLLAEIEAQALPSPPPAGSELARQLRDEFALYVGPGELVAVSDRLVKLAGSPRRDLVGVMLSPWFESWAASRGGPDPKVTASIRGAAVAGAAKHGTDAQRAAAASYASVRTAADTISQASWVRARIVADSADEKFNRLRRARLANAR